MKKVTCILLFFIIAILVSTCKKEVYKEVKRVQETNGLMIKPDSVFVILENTEIVSSQITNTINYEGKVINKYELTIKGENLDKIKPGTVVVDKNGRGKIYLIIKPINGGKSDYTKSLQSLVFLGVDISLDFLFNYEGAEIIFTSPENRAKKNSSINGKINVNLITDDLEKFVKEEENWSGYSSSRDGDLINLNFSGTSIGMDEVDGNHSINLELGGYIRLNPGIDFMMEYNPQYLKTGVDGLVSYIMALTGLNPYDLFGRTALTIGTLKELKAISYTELDYGFNLELSVNEEIPDGTVFRKRIAKFFQAYYPAGWPFSVETELSLEVDLSCAGELNASYFYQKENDIVLGFDLIQNLTESQITWYRQVNSRSQSGGSLVAKIELSAGIYLVLETEVYIISIIGPQVEARGYIKGGLDFWAGTSGGGWEMSVDAGLSGNVSLDLSMFHWDKATWKLYTSQDINFLEYNIYRCPYSVKVIGGDNQIGNIGQKLPDKIRVQVFDKWNKPLSSILPAVPVYFGGNDITNFNGNVPQSPVLTTNGIAETDWILDNTNESQKLLTFLKSSDGSILGKTDTVYSTVNSNNIVTDIDGNIYKTVTIGSQVWMAENLKVTHYSDGISLIDGSGVSNMSPFSLKKYWFFYNDDISNKNKYGLLYSWAAIMNDATTSNQNPSGVQGVCPVGWHVPSDEEWKELEMNLGMSQIELDKDSKVRGTIEGDKLKEFGVQHWNTPGHPTEFSGFYTLIGQKDWNSPNTGTNSSGFTALPSGKKNRSGTFDGLDQICSFWSTTNRSDSYYYAYSRTLFSSQSGIYRFMGSAQWDKTQGFAVRCIKD